MYSAVDKLENVSLLGYILQMSQQKSEKKKKRRLTRSGVPILSTDQDFLNVFNADFHKNERDENSEGTDTAKKRNRHGLPVLDQRDAEPKNSEELETENIDFEVLLEAYFKNRSAGRTKSKTSVPLKKRLKRYPLPEVELDLHGLTAAKAEAKSRNFILTCKQRGFYTLRIIVGKGLHSDFGAVLPDVIEDLLRKMQKEAYSPILWYEWDRNRKKAGSGAVVVYLKQFERYDE